MTLARRLTPDDAEMYAAFRREMLHNAPWAFGSSPGEDRKGQAESIRASLARPDFAIVAVPEAGALLAAGGLVREEQAKRRHIATVWGVYVAPAARGRGLARMVMHGLIDAARQWEGIECVQLSVSEQASAARRLYESLGFVVWGQEPNALRTGGQSFSEYHMALKL